MQQFLLFQHLTCLSFVLFLFSKQISKIFLTRCTTTHMVLMKTLPPSNKTLKPALRVFGIDGKLFRKSLVNKTPVVLRYLPLLIVTVFVVASICLFFASFTLIVFVISHQSTVFTMWSIAPLLRQNSTSTIFQTGWRVASYTHHKHCIECIFWDSFSPICLTLQSTVCSLVSLSSTVVTCKAA